MRPSYERAIFVAGRGADELKVSTTEIYEEMFTIFIYFHIIA
jgi:hypothetical protein